MATSCLGALTDSFLFCAEDRDMIEGQGEDFIPAKRGKKKITACTEEKKNAKEDSGSELIPKSETYKVRRRKKGEYADQTQEQEAEDTNPVPDQSDCEKKTKTRKRQLRKPDIGNIMEDNEEGAVCETINKHPCKSCHKYVGAHVSIQGGLWKAAVEAKRIGAKAFGLFLRSQRTWNSKNLEEEAAETFRRTCKELGFASDYILPHSPYLMNLGSPKPDVLQKSRAMLVDELNRCHQLGLTLYNIHPGSHVGAMPVNKCLELIADGINSAHLQVPGVTVVLENMSCQGSTVGGRFEELRGIIDHVADKSRIGVCLDTCHAFAAGHDLSKKTGLQKMLDEFSQVVGLSYLKAVHLNDSKGAVGCRLDRHENIGRGHIGLEGFRQVMNETRFNEIPMILETPYSSEFEDCSKEIDLLYSLCRRGQQ